MCCCRLVQEDSIVYASVFSVTWWDCSVTNNWQNLCLSASWRPEVWISALLSFINHQLFLQLSLSTFNNKSSLSNSRCRYDVVCVDCLHISIWDNSTDVCQAMGLSQSTSQPRVCHPHTSWQEKPDRNGMVCHWASRLNIKQLPTGICMTASGGMFSNQHSYLSRDQLTKSLYTMSGKKEARVF